MTTREVRWGAAGLLFAVTLLARSPAVGPGGERSDEAGVAETTPPPAVAIEERVATEDVQPGLSAAPRAAAGAENFEAMRWDEEEEVTAEVRPALVSPRGLALISAPYPRAEILRFVLCPLRMEDGVSV